MGIDVRTLLRGASNAGQAWLQGRRDQEEVDREKREREEERAREEAIRDQERAADKARDAENTRRWEQTRQDNLKREAREAAEQAVARARQAESDQRERDRAAQAAARQAIQDARQAEADQRAAEAAARNAELHPIELRTAQAREAAALGDLPQHYLDIGGERAGSLRDLAQQTDEPGSMWAGGFRRQPMRGEPTPDAELAIARYRQLNDIRRELLAAGVPPDQIEIELARRLAGGGS